MTKNNRSIYTLIGLFVLFLGPIVAAYVLFQTHTGSWTDNTTNRGMLISPVKEISVLKLETTQGKPLSLKSYEHKWFMVYVTPNACGEACQQNLYNMRQIRKALGKNQDRFERMLVSLPKNQTPSLNSLIQKEYKGTIEAITNQKSLTTFTQQLPNQVTASKQGALYIMDPHGNLVLTYDPEINPRDILKDITILLKASAIG